MHQRRIEAVLQAAAAIATGQCDVVVIADAQAGQYVRLFCGNWGVDRRVLAN